MMKTQLYQVQARSTDSIHESFEISDQLGAEIVKLANAEKAHIWFHELLEPAPGGPGILLECTPEFLEKVKTLPNH